MVKKYTKQDEKVIKDLMNTLYDQHKLSGGSSKFFSDFVHGFTIPFKQFGHLLSLIPEVGPALASVVTPIAEAVDKAVPGHRYETISDAFSGKPIKGTGRGRGRPRKIPKEIKIDVNIEDPTKRDKVFTESAKQLIDEENKNVVGERPRGRPKKIEGGNNEVGEFFLKTFRPKKYAVYKAQREELAADRMAKNTAVGSGFVGDYIRKKNKEWVEQQAKKKAWLARKTIPTVVPTSSVPTSVPTPATVVGSGKRRGRPKGSKNKK